MYFRYKTILSLWRKIFDELINPKRNLTRIIVRSTWEMIEIISSRKKPNKGISISTYVVDLDSFPISFNIAELLLAAELMVSKKGHDGYRLVVIDSSTDRTKKCSIYDPERFSRQDDISKIWNIILGCMPLSPNLKDVAFLKNREDYVKLSWTEDVYPKGYNVYYNKQPLDLWSSLYLQNEDDLNQVTLTAPSETKRQAEQYFNSRGIKGLRITFVIRSQTWDVSRNSNLPEWITATRELISRKICVTVIPDSDNPFCTELDKVKEVVFRDPCWDVKLRMAIYESSDLVVGTHGGALALAAFSRNTNVIALNRYPQGSIVNNKHHMEVRLNSRPGQLRLHVLPYRKDKSSVKEDTALNIISEIDDFIQKIS